MHTKSPTPSSDLKSVLLNPPSKSEWKNVGRFLLILLSAALILALGSGRSMAQNELVFNPKIDYSTNWSVFPQVTGHSLEQIEVFRKAFEISGGDRKFTKMLKGENGAVKIDTKSNVPNEQSYGFCQIHQGYHPEIVNDKRFFMDMDWQLGQCYRLYKGGTKFYGVKNIPKISHFFTFAT